MKTYSTRQLFDEPVVTLKDVRPDWSGDLNWEVNLDLRGTKITELPDNLTVGGSLLLEHTKITELPDNLKVGDDLYLYGTQTIKLPEDLKVGRWIYVLKGHHIYIPKHLKDKVVEL